MNMVDEPFAGRRTGMPDLDQGHALLGLLKRLDQLCEPGPGEGVCASCEQNRPRTCEASLRHLMVEILRLTMDQFVFEEKAMRALPKDSNRAEQLQTHLRDHEEIVRELCGLAHSAKSPDINQQIKSLQLSLRRRLGEHILNLDVPLAIRLHESVGMTPLRDSKFRPD